MPEMARLPLPGRLTVLLAVVQLAMSWGVMLPAAYAGAFVLDWGPTGLVAGIGFGTAARVFDDPLHLSVQDRIEEGEERWQTLGMIGPVVVLVAHAWFEDEDGEVIRIISARKATRRERLAYEQEC